MEYETYEIRKLCPFRIGSLPPADRCVGGKCGWWCEFGGECAVPLLAGMMADSDICKTAFGREYSGAV